MFQHRSCKKCTVGNVTIASLWRKSNCELRAKCRNRADFPPRLRLVALRPLLFAAVLLCWQWRRQICVHRHNKPCREQHCRGVRWYVLRVSAYVHKDLPLLASDVNAAVKVSYISTAFTCWHTSNVSYFFYFFHDSPDRMGWDLIPGESSESWRSRCRCFEKILERKTKFIKSLASKGTRLIFHQSIPKLKKNHESFFT